VTFSVFGASGAPLIPDEVEPEPDVLDAVNVRFMLSYIPAGEENKINYHEQLRDRGGVYTDMGDGVWHYKFATVLPEDYEADATHTLAATARRDLRSFEEYGLERYYDNEVYNFVPSGAGDPMPRDIVATATCNNCHNPIFEHGGTYREVQVCTQCHNPAMLGAEEPGELSYEFSALIHRTHSSQEPQIGTVRYPADLNDC
jgi:OmcA/MtrC family decaheme c-type cytochrome